MTAQTWNAGEYRENAAFVADLGLPVVGWLSPKAGEHILDLGCGDGGLTLKLTDFGCDVLGVDSSEAMVEAAREQGLRAEVMDGQKLSFDEQFDAVFSNAALHWMKEPEKVVGGFWRSLRRGGRFVGEFGGAGNIQQIETVIRQTLSKKVDTVVESPWYFPSPGEYQTLLESAGFCVERISLFKRPTPLPGDVSGWLKTFGQPYFAALSEEESLEAMREVVETLRPQLMDSSRTWMADYVRLRFLAIKPDD